MAIKSILLSINMLTINRSTVEACVVQDPFTNGVRKSDSNGILDLFCADNPPNNETERFIRGTIFQENDVIFSGFPYSYEFSENIPLNIENQFKNLTVCIYPALEATIIRVFVFEGEWIISTHRKLDAYTSKWASIKSFGDLFEDAVFKRTNLKISEFLSKLNVNHQYEFLITAVGDARIVINDDEIPNIYLAAVFENGKILNVKTIAGVFRQEEIFMKSIDKESIELQLLKMDSNPEVQGIIIICQITGQSWKFYTRSYYQKHILRNNVASIPFAYLHNIGNETKRAEFKKMYKHCSEKLEKYDLILEEIIKSIHKVYIERFINRNECMTTKNKHSVVQMCHKKFIDGKIQNKKVIISEKIVREILFSLDAVILNRLIKENLTEKRAV